MAVHVVDLLETVEIDQNDRNAAILRLGTTMQIAHGGGDTAAVVTAGEWVEKRLTARFGFGKGPIFQFVRHRVVAPPTNQDDCDVQKHRARQCLVRRIG